MEATEARESGKDSMKMEISYDMSGVAVTVKVMQDLTYTGKTMDDEILMDMQMEFMGQNMTNTVYYKDQNAYMSVMGQKVKSPIASQEELNEALSLEESGTDDLDLTEENFKKAALTDNGDGTQTLTAELSDEMAASFSKELLESMEIASDSLNRELFSGDDDSRQGAGQHKDGYQNKCGGGNARYERSHQNNLHADRNGHFCRNDLQQTGRNSDH